MYKLDQLPAEVISLIVDHIGKKYLYACALVNKSFCSATIPLLWHSLKLTNINLLTNIINTMETSKYSPGNHVRKVRVTFRLSENHLLALIKHIPLLEHLDLVIATDITDSSFQGVPRNCPCLVSIHIQFPLITHKSIMALGQLYQLEKLHICSFRYLDEKIFFSALSTCPLKEVHLVTCGIDALRTRQFGERAALALHRDHRHRLTSLRLEGGDHDYTTFITTAITHSFRWSHLTDLYLESCTDLDDMMVLAFIQSHPGLQTVAFIDSDNITDATLDAIATYLPNIVQVGMDYNDGITAIGVRRLVDSCAKLKNGITCNCCGINPYHDVDFPKELHDSRLYETYSSDAGYDLAFVKSRRF